MRPVGRLEFQEYRVRKIVNVHKHVDGSWFWGKYTAHPYVGCRSGCEFCYARGGRYLGRRAPDAFDSLIQEEIDALGGGKTISDWDARFELAYEKCKDANVTLVGGVAPTPVSFARYLHRKHRVYPKDLWKTQIVTLGSVPGINTRYRPVLRAMCMAPSSSGKIMALPSNVRPAGQQRDERKAWVPNYDLFFFEVETRSGVKMLHEMQAPRGGAWARWAAWSSRRRYCPATRSVT